VARTRAAVGRTREVARIRAAVGRTRVVGGTRPEEFPEPRAAARSRAVSRVESAAAEAWSPP